MPPVQLVRNEPGPTAPGAAPHPVPGAGFGPGTSEGPGHPGPGTGTGTGTGTGAHPTAAPHPGPTPGSGPTPDWAALADAAASRTRRKRLLYVGGGVLATLVVGALVATAVVAAGGTSSDGKNSALPSPESLPTQSAGPAPSFSPVAPPPPPDPKEFISSADKDKAPLSADTLFPGKSLTLEGRSYDKGATNRVTACASAAQGALGGILTRNGCDQVIRATFTKGGAAVTVGVAVFKTEAEALKAKNEVKDGIASLPGAGVPTFCRNGTICRKTANSYGRYAYFTVAGFTDNKRNVTTGDRPVFALGDDAAKYTFLRIVERGRTQASAAAASGTLHS
ncbi:hypothetical protein [Streptomyces sp. NPDC058657]|uniref:hypothetical protein n=1 Tax=unclassified Streptomyces TaxID=2593676 RepID=UPI0036545A48